MSGSIQASGASTAAAATTAAKPAGIAGDFNTFLTLLTAQLKNQDPTKAMDTNEMTSQLVGFASVEQQIAANTNLTKLIDLQQTVQLTGAAPLMGQTVEVTSDRLSLQNGVATLRLQAASASGKATIRVVGADGRILRDDTVDLKSTTQAWVWDGKNADGKLQPDGAYSFSVAGRDDVGVVQPVTATVVGTATAAARPSRTELQLMLGRLAVGFDAVRGLAAK